jgi:hypothetical protein
MTLPPHVIKYIEKQKKKKEEQQRERPALQIEVPHEKKKEETPTRHGWDYREP